MKFHNHDHTKLHYCICIFLALESNENEIITSTTTDEVLLTSTSTQLDIILSELEKGDKTSENNFFLIIEEEKGTGALTGTDTLTNFNKVEHDKI